MVTKKVCVRVPAQARGPVRHETREIDLAELAALIAVGEVAGQRDGAVVPKGGS